MDVIASSVEAHPSRVSVFDRATPCASVAVGVDRGTGMPQTVPAIQYRIRSTYLSDHQQIPDAALDQGWWERTSPPLFANRSSPQQSEWREDLHSLLSSQPDTPLRLRLACASAFTLSTCGHPHPFAIPTSQHAALSSTPYTGSVLPNPAGQLGFAQVAGDFRFPSLLDPHALDHASHTNPNCVLHPRSRSFPPRAQSRITSLFAGLTSWLRQQPLQRPSRNHILTHNRRSNSSEGSVAPYGQDRWPCTIATYTNTTVSAYSPALVQAFVQAAVQAPMQAVVQASRSTHSMEGDLLALAHLTKRYSQEADSPACQLDPVSSSLRSSIELLSDFCRDTTPHVFVSAYSRGGRFSLSYSAPLTRQDMNHTLSLAASSLLYHVA